jgi:DNA-binding CsgD family transcriptional regulator
VLKHAAPATVAITLDYGEEQFTAVLRDESLRTAPARATGSAGQGLIGMRERAILYGGTVHAGPRPGGGFEVRLVLPLPPGEEPAGPDDQRAEDQRAGCQRARRRRPDPHPGRPRRADPGGTRARRGRGGRRRRGGRRARRLVEAYLPPPRPERQPPELAPLTARETEILRLVGTGRSNAAIAQTLFVSEATVKTHLTRLMSKLDLSSRAQAVVTAHETGLVVPDGPTPEHSSGMPVSHSRARPRPRRAGGAASPAGRPGRRAGPRTRRRCRTRPCPRR